MLNGKRLLTFEGYWQLVQWQPAFDQTGNRDGQRQHNHQRK